MDGREVAWQILCSKKIIAYLVDIATHEIKFLSPAAMELCGISSEEELTEKACYRVIHGLEKPCEFCANERLRAEGKLHWQFYSSRLKCWANAQDSLVAIDGKEYRLEILEDLSDERRELEQKARQLELEKTLVRCIELLAYEENTDVAIAEFLNTIGSYYGADRVYIMEYSQSEKTCSCTFEWCRDRIEPQMGQLQEVSLKILKNCNRKFLSEGEFYVSLKEGRRDKPEEDYHFAKMKGVHSFAAVPFVQDSKISGFLGVDNPTLCINEWTLIRSVSSFVRDELKMRRMSRTLELSSYTDGLTGIGNRSLYQKRLKELQENWPGTVGIAVVDINGLKIMNDKYGHVLGDKIIIHTAHSLKAVFGSSAYRIGGDEFVVLCAGISREKFGEMIAQARSKAAEEKHCSISVGMIWKDMECSLEHEVSFADELMYAEKQKYYQEVGRKDRRNRSAVTSELLHDIQDGNYMVYLQPQYELQTGRMIGAEALARKRGGEGRVLLPGSFIPRLEEEGAIRYMDFFVLQTVCGRLREWKETKEVLPVAVNFSRITLMQPHVSGAILDMCRQYAVNPKYIKIEITESASEMGTQALGQLLGELKMAGIALSLDDFGYAYSNLSLAAEHDFSEIKLDMSMVNRLGKNKRMDIIVKNSIDAINALGSWSLAEGIETKAQLAQLIRFHAKAGQGFYFARPMPMEQFEKLIVDKKGRA